MSENINKKTISKNLIFTKENLIKLLLIIAGYIAIYYVVSADLLLRQYRSILVLIGCNIILAVSLNLVTGFLGELSIGHAGFKMVGAYAGAIFITYFSEAFPSVPDVILVLLAILIGGIMAALSGVIIGIPALRLKGDYLAITTLAFGEIIRSLAENLKITNGAAGMTGIKQYTNYKHFSYVYIIMIITIIVIANLIKSRQGRAILSIRENPIAAESIGIPLAKFKLIAFVLGSFFAGIAGVIHACNMGSIFPADAGYNESIDILVMVVLGGMGSIKGSVIAAIILTILPELLRDAADFRQLIYAVALIVMMLINSSDKLSRVKTSILGKLPMNKLQKKGE